VFQNKDLTNRFEVKKLFDKVADEVSKEKTVLDGPKHDVTVTQCPSYVVFNWTYDMDLYFPKQRP
jgi:hypothetical protein